MTGRKPAGFTLLEVMVAMAILALGLTTILSSQTGLFAAARRVQNETVAASLVRCKMSELEIELMKNGYPLLDQLDSGPCCEDESAGFSCEWKLETVELPDPSTVNFDEEGTEGEAGEGLDGEDGLADSEELSGLDLSSPGSDLSAAIPFAGTGVAGVEGVGDVASVLGDSTGAAAPQGGLVGMALSMVYPTLKPMLEASIRKITVRVLWREGEKEKDFEVVQYVTNPLEGNLNPNADEGLEELMNQLGQSGILDPTGSVDDGTSNSPGSSTEDAP